MPTKKHTISVRLDDKARRRIEQAAKLMKQSSGAFLEKVGEERAQQVLLEWAVSHYRQGQASLSELTEGTGLAIEEIMEAVGSKGQEEAMEMFMASCHTVAETQGNPEFLRLGQEAVQSVTRSRSGGRDRLAFLSDLRQDRAV